MMKFVKKIFPTGLLLGCISVFICSPSFSFAETITVAGTGDSQYLLRKLAQSFLEKHPDSHIMIPNSVGSGGGIKLLLAGRTELARIARPLKPKEQAEGLTERTFAYSPVVFIANLPEACVTNITTEQFIAIQKGTITNWNQLGNCPDHKIYIANREDGDSSKEVLEHHIPEMSQIENPAGRTVYSTPEACDTLGQYRYSFGYLPQAQIQKKSLIQFAFEGVAPSIENVQNGHYKLVVPFGIVWQGQPTGLTQEFIDYLFSKEAREIMLSLNAVPAKTE